MALSEYQSYRFWGLCLQNVWKGSYITNIYSSSILWQTGVKKLSCTSSCVTGKHLLGWGKKWLCSFLFFSYSEDIFLSVASSVVRLHENFVVHSHWTCSCKRQDPGWKVCSDFFENIHCHYYTHNQASLRAWALHEKCERGLWWPISLAETSDSRLFPSCSSKPAEYLHVLLFIQKEWFAVCVHLTCFMSLLPFFNVLVKNIKT